MNTKIEYTCKFCGKHNVLTTDIPADCPPLELEHWKKMLVCDSCADYERSRRDTEELIRKQAIAIMMVRKSNVKVEKLSEVEQKCRENLVWLTKKLAELVCARNHKPITWEPDVVNSILEHPDRLGNILGHFKRSLGTFVGSRHQPSTTARPVAI